MFSFHLLSVNSMKICRYETSRWKIANKIVIAILSLTESWICPLKNWGLLPSESMILRHGCQDVAALERLAVF